MCFSKEGKQTVCLPPPTPHLTTLAVLPFCTKALIVEMGSEFTKTAHLSTREWLITVALGSITIPLGVAMRFIPVKVGSRLSLPPLQAPGIHFCCCCSFPFLFKPFNFMNSFFSFSFLYGFVFVSFSPSSPSSSSPSYPHPFFDHLPAFP